MDRHTLSSKLIIPEFDYSYLLNILGGYQSPRDQITKLIREKTIVRIKKGIYVLGDVFNRPFSHYVLSNLIYGPSYVSGLSAMSYYGAIPEKVTLWQSATPNRKKIFNTPVGNFSYYYLHMKKYRISIELAELDNWRHFLIASPEKAVIELISREKAVARLNDIYDWIESMRIDPSFIRKLRLKKLNALKNIFNDVRVDFFIKAVKEIKNEYSCSTDA